MNRLVPRIRPARVLSVLATGVLLSSTLGVATVAAQGYTPAIIKGVSGATAGVQLVHGGSVTVSSLVSGGAAGTVDKTYAPAEFDLPGHSQGLKSNTNRLAPEVLSIPYASVSGSTLYSGSGAPMQSFNGLTNYLQRSVSGFSVEPPDMGLCQANGYVMQLVNLGGAIYTTGGAVASGPFALDGFFWNPFGANLSDPKCVYNQATGHLIASVLEYTYSGGYHSYLAVNISDTSDPTGSWTQWIIGGGYLDAGLADQPLLGYDANGVYISTNDFNNDLSFSATILAVSLSGTWINNLWVYTDLADGTTNCGDSSCPAFSVQPAQSLDYGAPGTEYFASSTDWNGVLTSQVGVWALQGTGSMASTPPTLVQWLVNSESYANPVLASQANSRVRPLGMALGQPVSYLDGGDDRMMQVAFRNGHLWSALDTAARIGSDPTLHDAAAWFDITAPTRTAPKPALNNQGYVAVSGLDITYPSVSVDQYGARMVYTMTGSTMFPSVGYSNFSSVSNNFPVAKLAAVGVQPEDGFTCYTPWTRTDPSSCRYGDYSAAAVASDSRSIWIAQEYMGGLTRSYYANWGTRILQIGVGS